MSQQQTEIIDLTFLGTDNHRSTHRHLLTLAYSNLRKILLNSEKIDECESPFIDNSSIQMRLFDGIGCKGTKINPRPGNYTWNENFAKTEIKTREKISNELAKLTGSGMQALLDEAEQYIQFIIKKNKNTLPKTINLKGYSRGADACIRLANRIYEKYLQIKVNLFLVDPVPGPFHRDDDGSYIIPGNVKRLEVTFMKDEQFRFYKPQHMGRLVIQNSITTQVIEHYLDGVHGEALYIDQGKEDKKINSHIQTQTNLTNFTKNTTQKEISLVNCYRDRTKKPEEQFSHHEQTSNQNNNKHTKSSYPSLKMFYHQERKLVQENHQKIAENQQTTQSEELQFYQREFRGALNFYHYHYPYSQKRRTTFETLCDALLRIKDILLGKTMEEKTKIWPDHYAAVLMQDAWDHEPLIELSDCLNRDVDFTVKLNEFCEMITDLNYNETEEINLIRDPLLKYQKFKNYYIGRSPEPVVEGLIFPNHSGRLTEDKKAKIDTLTTQIDVFIHNAREKYRLEKFKKTMEEIKKLPNSKFFKATLQTYKEYQDKFKSTKFEKSYQTMIEDTKETEKLHELYAIGQPLYIQGFMLSERKIQHQKQQKHARNIDIAISRRL